MRYFPSAARQRLVAASAVAAMALGALAIPLANADPDNLEHQQKQVEGQVAAAQQDLDESSSELIATSQALDAARTRLVGAKGALADVRTQLADARAVDADLQTRLEAAEAALATAQSDLGAGRDALETQRLAVTDTVTSIYEEGDPRLLAISAFLDAQTPSDITRRMSMKDVVVGAQTRAYDDLHAAEVLLQVRERQVADAEEQVADQRAQAAEHLTTVEGLHRQAREAKASVRDLVTSTRSARQAANTARRNDRAQLVQLRSENARIKERILKQARRKAERQALRAARGNGKGAAGYTGDQGGFLMHPVTGPVTSPFGYRIHPIYGYWGLHDGTDFGVACGEGLAAAATGTVMQEYYSSVYGNRLYLNVGVVNGKNLTVVYNHLSGYRAQVGDTVQRGDIVGYVGDTGWSTGCHLHFSVLVDGDPVDPMGWF